MDCAVTAWRNSWRRWVPPFCAGVLTFKLFELPGLIQLQPAVGIPPPVVLYSPGKCAPARFASRFLLPDCLGKRFVCRPDHHSLCLTVVQHPELMRASCRRNIRWSITPASRVKRYAVRRSESPAEGRNTGSVSAVCNSNSWPSQNRHNCFKGKALRAIGRNARIAGPVHLPLEFGAGLESGFWAGPESRRSSA